MTQDRVMLLIDADNVSVDVIEQAVARLLETHGALHVRRAYGTAESAVKHQAVFRRLGIKPMVNLSAGKNSTDIALAVDAIDLVLAERPDIVAIASSDSDFAPLVHRLREKGCRVVGIGQAGKTGDETLQVYDEFTVLAHHAPVAGKTPRARKTTAAKAPAAAAAAKKTPTRRKAASSASPAPPPAPAPPPRPALPEKVQQILDRLPELVRGETVELRVASVRLREAGLLSRSGSSTRLFGQFADRFELTPAGQPNHVRLRAEGTG
jgi:uncharacterized protein (TIGR00288 family)